MNYVQKFKSQTWYVKCFILLILFRPVIDIFWWIRDIEPLLSPLNWAGVLPVVLLLVYMLKSKSDWLKTKDQILKVKGVKLFLAFSVLILMNSIGLLVNGFLFPDFSIFDSLAVSIKLISLPLFFLFLFTVIDEDVFDLILKAFLLSTLFPFLMIIYEILIGPINPYTPGGRHFERFRGLYSDGINYTIYWMIGLITSAYFYIKNNSKSNLTFYFLLFTFVLIPISLYFLNQAVAYFIFTFLFTLVLIFVFKKNKIHFLALALSLTLIIVLLYIPGISKISTLFPVDKEVIEGKLEIVHAANGRVWIWVEGLKRLSELPVYTWLFGAALTKIESFNYMTGGAHNDYLRILYSTGGTGLILYLLFIFGLFKGFGKLTLHCKFLLISTICSLLLFSVTHTPTFYLSVVYFLTTVLARFLKTNISANDTK